MIGQPKGQQFLPCETVGAIARTAGARARRGHRATSSVVLEAYSKIAAARFKINPLCDAGTAGAEVGPYVIHKAKLAPAEPSRPPGSVEARRFFKWTRRRMQHHETK